MIYGGLLIMTYGVVTSPEPPQTIFLQTEDDDFILTEDNKNIEIE